MKYFCCMRMASNHIGSVSRFYREELKGLFDSDEIEQFIFYSAEHILGLSRSELSLSSEKTISESELLKFNRIVNRLKEQDPLQYILAEAWFLGLKLKVNGHVLIPRPETEELVEWVINSLTKKVTEGRSKFKILDIGTGSGCIAIALKKEFPEADVFALDLSKEALEVAKENAALNSVQVNFMEVDIFRLSSMHLRAYSVLHPEGVDCFDLIISNPPYVLQSEKPSIRMNVLKYEPPAALFVEDEDALLYYKAIIRFAKKQLNPGGNLYFEINESRGAELESLLGSEGFAGIELKKDINRKDRLIKAEKR